MRLRVLFLFFALSLFGVTNAQVWNQLGSNINGTNSGNQFGTAVATNQSGTTIAVTEPSENGSGSGRGQVKVFTLSGNSWTQLGNAIEGPNDNEYLGHAVTLSDDGHTLAVSSSFYGNFTGAVWIYTYNNGTWTQDLMIAGQGSGDGFGYSIELSGDGNFLVVGAKDESSKSGVTRVYSKANSWSQVGSDITGEATWDESGYSVSISQDGSIIAVGAYHNSDNNNSNAGHVRVFQNQSNTWTQLGADIDGEAAYDESGVSVSLNAAGNIVAIGAKSNGPSMTTGHVRVYEYSNNSWAQKGTDLDGPSTNSQFGKEVKINDAGDRIAVVWQNDAASATANITTYDFSNNAWTKYGQDIPNAKTGSSNARVAINGDGSIILMGDLGDGNGLARVFSNCSTAPSITKQPLNMSICEGDSLTFSVDATDATKYQWQIQAASGEGDWFNGDEGKTYGFSKTNTYKELGLDKFRFRCVVSNMCKSDTSDTVTLTINTHMGVDINANGSTLKGYYYDDNVTPDYQWYTCGSNNALTMVNGANEKSYSPTGTGSYAVVSNNNGCKDTSSCFSFNSGCPEIHGPTLHVSGCEYKMKNGKTVSQTSTVYDTLASKAGCDSIVTINFTLVSKNKRILERIDIDNGLFEDSKDEGHFNSRGKHLMLYSVVTGNSAKVYAAVFEDNQYKVLGSAIKNYSSSDKSYNNQDHGITVDKNGNYYVVLNDFEQGKIVAYKLVNNTWTQHGSAFENTSSSNNYVVKIISAGDDLFMGYVNNSSRVFVMKVWNGSDWQNIGGAEVPQTVRQSPVSSDWQYVISPKNELYVRAPYFEVFKVSSSAVNKIVSIPDSASYSTKISIDKNDDLYVSGQFRTVLGSSPFITRVMKYENSNFVTLGQPIYTFVPKQGSFFIGTRLSYLNAFLNKDNEIRRYRLMSIIHDYSNIEYKFYFEKFENNAWIKTDSIDSPINPLNVTETEYNNYILDLHKAEVWKFKRDLIEFGIDNLGDSAVVKTPQIGVTYQWLDCDNNKAKIDNKTDSIFTTKTQGNFAVELTYHGCIDTSACEAVAVGFDEIELEGVNLYPNPTSENFIIDLYGVNRSVTVTISDVSGKIIAQNSYNNVNRVNLATPEAKGIYFVRINEGKANKIFKLIKK